MNQRFEPRRERTVRLSDHEWDTAVAISRMGQDRSSAGAGLREALRMAEDAFTDQGRGNRLHLLREQVRAERERNAR